MKKLIIAAAAVAMGVSAQAKSSKELDAQVYDFSLTAKTTTCKEVKYTKTIARLEGEVWDDVKGEKIAVRKQTSMKIVGVIWGCDCPTWADPGWAVYNNGTTIGGYLFWNQKTQTLLSPRVTRFAWGILNRIEDGNKVEGVWKLWNTWNRMALYGAGFGKAKGNLSTCMITLTSMSGNFAGYIMPGLADKCQFCGGDDTCTAWQVCPCAPRAWHPSTIGYGSWSIKYNKSASNKLYKYGRLTQSYTFKKAGDTATRLAWLEEHIESIDPTASEDDDEYSYGYDSDEDEEWELDRVPMSDTAIATIGAYLEKGAKGVVVDDDGAVTYNEDAFAEEDEELSTDDPFASDLS